VSAGAARVDAFGLTPDTGAYVPREATERALAALVAAVQGGGAPAAILGGAGVGKTLLLHLLAERAGPGLPSDYLPTPRRAPEELCTWVARRIGAPAGEDAELFVRAWVGHLREQEQGCLLLVDDADAMPVATARWLAAFAAESRGGLRLVLAALESPAAERVLRAFGELQRVELAASMSPAETAEYIGWRLARADVPETVRARFDAAAVAELHRVAQGNPRRLHLAVESLVRGGSAAVLEDEIAERGARAPDPGAAPPPAPHHRTEPGPPRRAGAQPTAGSPPRAEGPGRSGRSSRSAWMAVLLGAGAVALAAGLSIALYQRVSDPARTAPPGPTVAVPAGPGATRDAAVELVWQPKAEPAAAVPAPTGGTLGVHLNAVPWARVEVDGIDVGETPLANVPLRPGPHTFRAHLPDGRILERTVEIDAAHRHVVFE
jgi:type II secretory pathway predicted ATPase ExeA